MAVSSTDRTAAARMMGCPTCGARQQPTDTCRRCKCDLSLLRSVHEYRELLRGRALACLKQRRIGRATHIARACYRLSPDREIARLLAVCYVMQGQFAPALRLFQPGGGPPAGP